MTRRGKWVRPQAQRYLAWRKYASWRIVQAWRGAPLSGPVAIRVWVRVAKGRRGDLDNYLKAALDAANGLLWCDDRQVVRCTVAFVDAAQVAGSEESLTLEVCSLAQEAAAE